MAKTRFRTEWHELANDLMGQLSEAVQDAERIDQVVALKMKELRHLYQDVIEKAREKVKTLEAKLLELVKKRKRELFSDGDKSELPAGVLLLQVKERVHRARCVLAQLEELGRADAIKIAKSVDWDLLEKWTDEDLHGVGTKRIREELFTWDLKKAN